MLEQNRFGSCSSRFTVHVDTFDADVINFVIDEVDLRSSYDAAALADSDDIIYKFSIVNDHTSEEVDTLAAKRWTY